MKKSFSTFLVLSTLLLNPIVGLAEEGPVQSHDSLEWFELMQEWIDTEIDETTIELHEEADKTLEAMKEAKKEIKEEILTKKKKNEKRRAERLRKQKKKQS